MASRRNMAIQHAGPTMAEVDRDSNRCSKLGSDTVTKGKSHLKPSDGFNNKTIDTTAFYL
jgi:hypothetical protein